MLAGSMGRAALLVAASFALCAHGYSPQPVGALSSDVDTREYCGRLGLPACVSEEGGNIVVHSCFSDGHPTVGAVDTNGTYMCVLCGEPNLYACECTHDNNSTLPDHYSLPCSDGLSHWCLYYPQYVVTEETDGRF